MKKISLSLLFIFMVNTAKADDKLWIDGSQGSTGVEMQLPSFAPIIEKLGKAVVNLSIEGSEKIPQRKSGQWQTDPDNPFGGGGGGNSPFDFFLPFPPDGNSKNGRRTFSSLGSGFVINPDGYIITNAHVIDKADKIHVSFRDDKKTYEAKVIGKDYKTDIALLKVNFPVKIPAVVLGDSDKINPGDWVIAIGNPFRLGHTATVGIVSAKSRRVAGGKPYDNFIQTDASINPGNSGGPLFNAQGEVIGINTAIVSPIKVASQGFNVGIGFATPINFVKSIVAQLHGKGKVTRGWLGVLIQPISEDVAEALKLTDVKGSLVADVMPNSPAAKAGLMRGDVILSFNGKAVNENDELPLMVAETEIGKDVDVEVIRAGKKETVKIKIEELAEDVDNSEDEKLVSPIEESILGLTVQDLTPDLARGIGIEDTKGVIVTDVAADSPAMLAGLKPRDIILEIASTPIASVKDFKQATKGVAANKPLLILLRRGGNTIFLTLKVEK